MAAYFARSQDIGDLGVLSELAAAVGLDPLLFQQALATGLYAGKRRAAHDEAGSLDISGVPTYIFAGGVKVVGAQPLGHFRRLLEEMEDTINRQ